MDIIILCGGKGRRMGADKPKPLMVIDNKSLLEWQLDEINGLFRNIFVVVNPKHIGDFSELKGKHKFTIIPQEEPLGTWHGLEQVPKSALDDDFVLIYGDCFYSRGDTEKLMKVEHGLLIKTPNPLTGGVIVKENDTLSGIMEKEGKTDLCNIGAYKLTKQGLVSVNKMEKGKRGEYEITTLINKLAKFHEFKIIEAETWAHHTFPDDVDGINETRDAYDKKDKVFVNALFVNNKRVLLQQRDEKPFLMYPGYWQIFGGMKKNAETEEDCLLREIKEELNIDLKPSEYLKKDFIQTMRGKDIVFIINKIIGEDIKLYEGRAKKYFSKEELKKLKVVPIDKFILRKVLDI